MYKDKSRQRQANKENKRKARGYDKGMTTGCDKTAGMTATPRVEGMTSAPKGVTSTGGVTEKEGMTEEFDATKTIYPSAIRRLEARGVTIPEVALVLPASTIKTVLAALWNRAALGLFDDAKERWQRAVTWYDWDKAGRSVKCEPCP